MKPIFYGHPFSSYTQKALIALYENGVEFEYRHMEHPGVGEELQRISPMGKFPTLVDGDRVVLEASTIIEYLQIHYAGPAKLIPDDADRALAVRELDRIFDNYVHTPMQSIVANALRPEDSRDPYGVNQYRQQLDRIYAWLDQRLPQQGWATGANFTLADCAAAPSLFYADWAHPIPERHATLRAYRARLLAHPSVARAVDEARPYRHYFPLGAPDRD